jgi:predicted DCC family thiol-disulfide oxidoreductase YuxK
MTDRQRPDGSSSSGTPTGAPVLLYDGACGLCASSVQLVLRHDPHGPLRFASLQGAFGRAVVARHEALRGVDSMVWVEPSGPATAGGGPAGAPLERVYVRSDAVLRVCGYLGGAWSLLGIGAVVPRALRDGLYALVARHRHALATPVCVLPTDAQRARFID